MQEVRKININPILHYIILQVASYNLYSHEKKEEF